MALIDDLRSQRATAITNYYNNFSLYLTKLAEDGDNTYVSGEEDQFQAKFKAFNDLVYFYYNLLNIINGYVTGSTLPNDEGSVGSTDWWKAVDSNDSRAPMYITDRDYADYNNSFFIMNNKSFPNKRDPYLHYNQYHTILGSYDNRAWKNTPNISDYTETENPLATDENYRLAEPLEWWGNTNNLIWSKIVYDGYRKYRNIRLKDSTFTTYSNSGFMNWLFEDDHPIDNRFEIFTDSNIWPSPYEIMRYSYYGDGSNTAKPTVSDIYNTSTNSFTINNDVASNWIIGNIYLMWNVNNINEWYIFRVTNVTLQDYESGGSTEYRTVITIDNFNDVPVDVDYPDSLNVIESPSVPEANKIALQGDGYDKLWEFINNEYYSEFRDAANDITDKVNDIIIAINDIISFDYSAIIDEAGEELGLTKINTFKSDLQIWLNDWKNKINDTGSGLDYSIIDSNWSHSNLDGLADDSPSGLAGLINFASDFDDENRTGLLGNFISEVFSDILGDYNLGSGENWNPDVNNYSSNNSGDFGSGQQIYVYRSEAIKNRIGRNEGIIFTAYNAWKTWNAKLTEISALETRMGEIIPNNKYDITPIDFTATTEEDDIIGLGWNSVVGASSYQIEYKEGATGAWQVLEETFGYIDPGWAPQFNENPPPEYEVQAYTRGYQELGLSFSDSSDSTGLADGFTIYDFKISIDGSQEEIIKVKGLDCQTFEALSISIQEQLDEMELTAVSTIEEDDIRIASNKRGAGSTISLNDGDNNSLFSALSTTLDSPVDGIAVFTPGKTYHFKIKTNNGYGITLGPAGDRNDKDWDSHSEYDLINYENDIKTNGVIGYITWDAPTNILASGFPQDNDLTPSSNHIRVEWSPLDGAESYNLYRSTKENGGYQVITNTSDTYFLDTSVIPGVEYYYKVQGVSSSDYIIYDEDGNFASNLTSDISATPVRGKRLWIGLTLDASTDVLTKLTIAWNSLSGATGYILYKSNMENGTYSFIEEDDGTEKIIRDTEFVDRTPAQIFFENEFSGLTDGLTDYTPNNRYYFILTTDVIKQYYIETPSSGIWLIENIVEQLNLAFQEKADDVIAKIIKFDNPSLNYKIKLETKKEGSDANVNISRGTFGDSLTELLNPGPPEAGGGALPSVEAWYKVQAVEEVDGVIVRSSEFSNKAMGKRPIEI